jgi:hypothetical protein
MGTEIVNIYVGDPDEDEEEHFTVHKELLCNKVPYFEKMFKGGFAEAKTNTAKFPEDDPDTFDIFLGWLYERSLPPIIATVDPDEDSEHNLSWDGKTLYAMADKFCVPELMDVTMDEWRNSYKRSRTLPAYTAIAHGYEITSPGSLLRKYLAMACAYVITDWEENDWSIQDISDLSVKIPDLNKDIMEVMRESRGMVRDPRTMPDCDFHSHPKDIPCPWKKVKK